MTNANNKANVTRIESLASEVITAKGTQLRHAGFWAAVSPLAERSYRHGSDREQWTGKGSTARPLRSCWQAAFTPVNGKLPSTAGARAFRALAAFVAEEQNKKRRDTSPEGVDLFLSAAETIVAAILAPARAPKSVDKSAREKAAIEKAIKLLQDAKNNHILTSEQLSVLTNMLAPVGKPEPALA